MRVLFYLTKKKKSKISGGGGGHGEYRFKWVGCADGFLGTARFIRVLVAGSGQVV